MRAGLVAVAMAAGVLVGCGGRPTTASFDVAPRSALIDVPVAVSVRGLSSHAHVVLGASATDRAGARWSSSATVTASGSGVASLPDPMRLFELMTPESGSASILLWPAAGYDVTLTARVGSAVVARTTVRRVDPSAAGVTRKTYTVARDGVHGTLYLPAGAGSRRPGVLIFGGSEGGESTDFNARLLAGHGFPALSIAYFDAPGLPKSLDRIPLEYFAKALRLLSHSAGPMYVMGGSRGSEAALLLGVHYPDLVHGVVAASPSDHVSGAVGGSPHSAWTLHGREVPFAPGADFRTPSPSHGLIDVNAIKGPLMTICGQEDLLWPSCDFAAAMKARRGAPGQDVYLSYAGAGHAVDLVASYFSQSRQGVSGDGEAFGGDLSADLAASADAHARLLKFLR